MCQKKGPPKNKKTVFLWTHFLFDIDFNKIYFDLLSSCNDTQTSTNWWTYLFSFWNPHSCIRNLDFFPLYVTVIDTIQHLYFTLFPYFTFTYDDTLLQRNIYVLGEKEHAPDPWLHLRLASLEIQPHKKGTRTKTRARALPLIYYIILCNIIIYIIIYYYYYIYIYYYYIYIIIIYILYIIIIYYIIYIYIYILYQWLRFEFAPKVLSGYAVVNFMTFKRHGCYTHASYQSSTTNGLQLKYQ